MSTQRTSGNFVQGDPGPTVIFEVGANIGAGRTVGAVRGRTIPERPALNEEWTILGWTLRTKIGCFAQNLAAGAGQPTFAKFGDLWAGLIIGPAVPDAGRGTAGTLPIAAGGAALPQDLSTFQKVFDGSTDALPQVTDFAGGFIGRPIGVTYVLPAPIVVRTSDPGELQFLLVFTPTVSLGRVQFGVKEASFTIIYDEARVRT